jgi:hypothetical protein
MSMQSETVSEYLNLVDYARRIGASIVVGKDSFTLSIKSSLKEETYDFWSLDMMRAFISGHIAAEERLNDILP